MEATLKSPGMKRGGGRDMQATRPFAATFAATFAAKVAAEVAAGTRPTVN